MKRENAKETVESIKVREPKNDTEKDDISKSTQQNEAKEMSINDDISEELIKNVSDRIIRDFDESLTEDDPENTDEGQVTENEDENTDLEVKGKSKKKKILITIGSIFASLILIVVVLVATPWGRKALINFGIQIFAPRLDVVVADQDEDRVLFTAPTIVVNANDQTVQGEQSTLDSTFHQGDTQYRREEYVANILLAGLEEIKGGARSDSMMIASINIKDNTIKLTSIMRDCYVEIEGHGKNKLNAAYSFGGAKLLIDTIEKNFHISIDGYATVNFSSFEKIVDLLGGVDIELGKSEANYLNNNNYISNVSERNVTAGWNTLTGNQALGYARVRYATTLGGETNDQGRTLRQRRLLNAIFDKYKSKNLFELFTIMYDIMPEITTNLTQEQISDILERIVENKITQIDSYRIPADGSYSDVKNECGWVLILDFDENIQLLNQYIYLDEPLAVQDQTVEN